MYTVLNAPQFSSSKSAFYQRHIPSLKHFVEYILHETATSASKDRHCQSYSSLCDVCKFKCNFIGKLERLDADFSESLNYLNESDRYTRQRHNPSSQTPQYNRALFLPFKDELICRLKQFYADDFRLFDYRLKDYVDRPGLDCDRSLK